MPKKFAEFTISQVAIFIRHDRCLILEFADRSAGWWGLPGGRIDEGELSAEDAFRREIKEELGLTKFDILAVADYDIWYSDYMRRPVSGVANLIQSSQDQIKLSSEHISYRWVKESEIDNYQYIWPSAPRMIERGFALHKLLTKNKLIH